MTTDAPAQRERCAGTRVPEMRKGLDTHVRLSPTQTEFVRENADRLGVAPSDFIKFLIAQEIERRQWTIKE